MLKCVRVWYQCTQLYGRTAVLVLGLEVADGAVFAMSPDSFDAGRASEVLVAQLTIPVGASATVQMGMQGHEIEAGSMDWRVDGVIFELGSSEDPEAPSPSPSPSPTPQHTRAWQSAR